MAWSASLEKELATKTAEADGLSAKLATAEAALKATGDSGAKAQALAAELSQAKADLAAARDQAAEAKKTKERPPQSWPPTRRR